ncbi:hypothetical protein [Parabacteroides distasonis]|uniref:hypothetical protein n=1 Tax=Parabacteroides distasonis TaxID=823 RepID=UPI0037094680
MDGFEVEEIAGLTGSTPEAVRMNLSRARKRVRDQFFKCRRYENRGIQSIEDY